MPTIAIASPYSQSIFGTTVPLATAWAVCVAEPAGATMYTDFLYMDAIGTINHEIRRAFCNWDLSSIPNTATVFSASIWMKIVSYIGASYTCIQGVTLSDPMVVADFNVAGFSATRYSVRTVSAMGTWKEFVLNADGIAWVQGHLAGRCGMVFRMEHDYTVTDPNPSAYEVQGGNGTGGEATPYLVVDTGAVGGDNGPLAKTLKVLDVI